MKPTSDAAVAGTAQVEWLASLFTLGVRGESTRNLFLLLGIGRFLWADGFSRARNDFAILYRALDQPMILIGAKDTLINTVSAEIKVSHIADAAVPMNIWDGLVAVVAADSEVGSRRRATLRRCMT